MPRAQPYNSWRSILEEVGRRPSPKEWEKYGIPEGTPWKVAVSIRLFRAIIEEKAYYLLPKIFDYTEPAAKQIEVNVTDWRSQLDQLGVPVEVMAARLREMLVQALDGKYIDVTPADQGRYLSSHSITGSLEQPRDIELDSPRQPIDAGGHEEPGPGSSSGEVALGAHAQTETPRGDPSV